MRAGSYGVEKVFKLKAKGFAFGDVGPGKREAGSGVYDCSERGFAGGSGGRWMGGRGGGCCRDRAWG